MYKIYTLLTCLIISFSLLANEIHYSTNATLYDHMVSINQEWKTQEHQLDQLLNLQTSFETDDDRIQMHLMLVENVLRNRTTNHLSVTTKNNRLENLESLISYWKQGQFPKNTNHQHRQPYFIDQFGTACAVGHLLQTDGEQALAQRISLEQNYAYIRELQYPELGNWAIENGFETAELAWIQPAYGQYEGYEECLQFDGSPLNMNLNNKVNILKNVGNLLYIGGDFQMSINGAIVHSIVAYNGSNFIDLGIDIIGEVKDIISYNGALIIVGDFQDQSSMATNIIQYTPGSGYVGLQTGTMNGSIDVAEVMECVLFVGGDFTAIDGANHSYIAAYTPASGWTNSNINTCSGLLSESISVNGPVNDMILLNNRLIVGGEFTSNGASINNATPNGLSFYSTNGWTTPTLNPGMTLTSVDHLMSQGDFYSTAEDLLIGGNDLMGYDFANNTFVQGGCLGNIFIPANTGRIDAFLKNNNTSQKQLLYRVGNTINSLVGIWTLSGPIGLSFTYDGGSEINTLESYYANGQEEYFVGGQFSNLMLWNQLPSSNWCDEFKNNTPAIDDAPSSGVIYKFIQHIGMPVELTNFDATLVSDRQVDLDWQTQSEVNSSHYDIERSASGEENSFKKVGEKAAAGNSIQVINYYHTDRVTIQSNYLYYRLKIVDLDGSFEYSDTKVVKLKQTQLPDIKLFPNPAINQVELTAQLATTGPIQIQVYNLQGALVKDISYTATEKYLATKLDINDLAAGMYLLQVTNKSDQLVTKFQKF